MSDNRSSDFMAGAIFGAAIAGGIAFLFGTDQGRKIRRRIYDEYPELFDKTGAKLNQIGSSAQKLAKDNVKEAGKATESLGKQIQKAAK